MGKYRIFRNFVHKETSKIIRNFKYIFAKVSQQLNFVKFYIFAQMYNTEFSF
jgi:hypothetical protein